MPATTSRRPAARIFGLGILPADLSVDGFACSIEVSRDGQSVAFGRHHDGEIATVIRDGARLKCDCYWFNMGWSKGERCSHVKEVEARGLLPAPLSGGSDAATATAEVHHGDDYCSECGEFHEPAPHLTPSDHGYYAAFSGAPRSDAPKGADREGWLEGYDECVMQRGEPVKRGPTPEDVAFAMGLSAAIECRRPVDPPAGLSDMEWRAFNAGASAGMAEVCERLMDEAMRAEVDAEMASVYAGGN